MERKIPGIHPVLAAAVAFVVFVVLVFFGNQLLKEAFTLRALNPNATAVFQETIVTFVPYVGILLAALVALVVYLALSGHARAQRYAMRTTHDLAAAQKEFRQLYEQSPVPYVLLSPEGVIREPNFASERLFGYEEKSLEGKQLFELLVSDEEPTRVADLRERFLRTVALANQEIQIQTKSGATRWVLLSIFQIGDKAKRTHQGLATLVDITEQKEIDRAKTEFVSIASHQLKTPLSTVKWYTELLLNKKAGNLNPKQQTYVEKIDKWDRLMIDLVETLLNVSRIEMGTLVIEKSEVDIKELLAGILDEVAPKIAEKALSVKQNIPEDIRPLMTDQKLLRIAVQNLVTNAVKYTPPRGSISITVQEKGRMLELQVADTGYGIPPEAQSKIFTKMFRADNAKKADPKGTGLGLYLTKSFVEALGGTISFQSELNKGTVFTLSVPRR